MRAAIAAVLLPFVAVTTVGIAYGLMARLTS